jgi:hypothetical protein
MTNALTEAWNWSMRGMPRVFRTVLLACFHAANVSSVRPLRTSNGVL